MKTSQASTSPSPHFNVEKPEAIVCCTNCKSPLWSIEVRTTQGVIVSTKMLPIGKNKKDYDEQESDCPLCRKPYFKRQGKDRKFLVRSVKTGQEFFL